MGPACQTGGEMPPLTAVAVVAYSRCVICRLLDRAMKVPPPRRADRPTAGPAGTAQVPTVPYAIAVITCRRPIIADEIGTAPPRMPLERRDIAILRYSHASYRYTAIC